mgnify:FL=1|jgi:type I restriction-modification system DNA methylase subunit
MRKMSAKEKLTFNDALSKLGMDNESIGLRFVSKRKEEKNPDLFLALEQADEFGATAVYFRFYEDNRPPRPQIYLYDKSGLERNNDSDADIHHQLWNAGVVPFCFIFRASQVLVFNCSKKPSSNDSNNFNTSHHDLINLLSDAQQKLDLYSARKFDSGLFWESEQGKKFNYQDSAYQQLLKQLSNVKSIIISRVGKEHASLVKRLLMMLILIKYLEERVDDEGKGALNPAEFYRTFNPENPTLEGVLDNPDTFLAVLNELSKKENFNGQIFQLSDTEQQTLKKRIDLTLLQYFVMGDMEIFSKKSQSVGQMSLWKLYQFNYLPIELISHIYEDFLADENGQKKKGVVYTPPYLVQLLIDQCMPLDDPKEHFTILDPACGSGIFLVGAYKRMIQWWRLKNNWEKPGKENVEELKQLLQNNIYGCDIENEAVTLTYFSLSLALLDSLSPKEIWGNVHFDNLVGANLLKGDFFKSLSEGKLKNDFQLVIGNPPFESKLTYWAGKVDKNERENSPERPIIPDNQIALLFLEQSFKLLINGGNCCLILPSGPTLYNVGSHDFRRFLMERYHVKRIFDFSPLRAKLFIGSSSAAKPPVVAFFAEKSEPENRPCFHYIFRRTKVSGEKIDFEIDRYDIHKVSHISAINNASVWQANFMGGGRLHHLLDKIGKERTLGEYLDEKEKNHGWKMGEGWIESPNSEGVRRIRELSLKVNRTADEESEFIFLERKHKADWITGFNYVETSSFTEDGIKSVKTCKSKYFLRPRVEIKEVFQPPHLLIKESVGTVIPCNYSNEYLTFKDKIFGIHAPEDQVDELKNIKKFLHQDMCVPLMWLISGQAMTTREAVPLKNDILSLPYPKEEIEFDAIEKILLSDISVYYSEFRKLGEKSVVLNRLDEYDLETYGVLFCSILNSVYNAFKPLSPIIGKEFVAYPFVLGDRPETDIPASIEEIEVKLENLMESRQGYNIWVRRIVRVYHKNVIFIYKPNQKRYWLRSIAIRDADETFLDLYKQGK